MVRSDKLLTTPFVSKSVTALLVQFSQTFGFDIKYAENLHIVVYASMSV